MSILSMPETNVDAWFVLAQSTGGQDHAGATMAIHYLPIATTLICAAFVVTLLRRAASKGFPPHLVWWAFGVFTYGVGTALESSVTLFGNSIALNKAWYIAGALFGAWPLAQGSVYLHLRRKTAHILTVVTLLWVAAFSIATVLSPVNMVAFEPTRPGGGILEWTWIRFPGTPVINTYAVIFLIGGAVWSAIRFFQSQDTLNRAIGNVLIAVGATMPGVGGSMAKAGIVEALYVGELVGIIFIWFGYGFCVRTAGVTAPVTAIASPESAQPVDAAS